MATFTNVRYGKMGLVGRCRSERDDLRPRDSCIVRTDRGKELGTVLAPLQPMPEGMPKEGLFDIIRRATDHDLDTYGRIDADNRILARDFCRKHIERLKLPMKLVEVDFVFGGERIVFYFVSETRVDFRELVRTLAHEFRTRVELRQIGARDEARLVGDCGHCGMPLCCRGYLKDLGGIAMEMAKIQKNTSDPSKITGRCGKLLCCLRCEFNSYVEARNMLPKRGEIVETRMGDGRVVSHNLLLREVTIESESGERRAVALEDVVGVRVSREKERKEKEAAREEEAVRAAFGDYAPPIGTEVRRKIEEDTVVMPPCQQDAGTGVRPAPETRRRGQDARGEGTGTGRPRRRRRRRKRKRSGDKPPQSG